MDAHTWEERHLNTEAEIGVILSQAKECQELLAICRSQEKGTEQSLPLSP